MENHSLDSRLIGRAENVQAAECTQRFNAKIGHALFHSLFQHHKIMGRSLNERLYPQKSIRLWLLLPLNDQVRPTKLNCITKHDSAERASLKCSIGISDGRCVRNGGTFVRDRRLQLSVPSSNAVARLSFPASGNPRRLAAALSVVSTRW